jgi:hypothetical protein
MIWSKYQEMNEGMTATERELNSSGRSDYPEGTKDTYIDFKENRLDDTIDRLIGAGMNKSATIDLVKYFAENPDEVAEGYIRPEDFKDFDKIIISTLEDKDENRFTKDEVKDLEEDVLNPSPATDLTKLNVNELNQLKTLATQKEQIDKKIDVLKKQIMKESLNEVEATENPEHAAKMIDLFKELGKMEKRHARLLTQITEQLKQEKDELHLAINKLMADANQEETREVKYNHLTDSKKFSFVKYFTDENFKNEVDNNISALSESKKAIIANRLLSKMNGKTILENSEEIPDTNKLIECIEFYGQQNYRCRFIAESYEMESTSEESTEEVLDEMAIRQVKFAFILRWKDGTKPQQYLYPFDSKDKESIEEAKNKAVEAAEKKIAAGKNDVRVEDGTNGETITGEALKLGRTTGTSKKEILGKAKKIRDKASFLLISYRSKSTGELDAEEEEDKIKGLVPVIIEELKKLDRDILDFEEDFSKEHGVELNIDLYNTKAAMVKVALINKRMKFKNILVDLETEDILHLGTEAVNTSDEIDYEKDVYKDDGKEVIKDKLVDKDEDEDNIEEIVPVKKQPTEKQLAARKEFAKGSKGLDKKTQDALNKNR